MNNLEVLNLDKNKLTIIETNSFQHLSKLKRLILDNNRIKQIETNGFQGLHILEEFKLNKKSIQIHFDI